MHQTLFFIKKRFSWQHLNFHSMLHRYRYLSLAITSAFYLVGPLHAPLYLKLGVVLSLFLEAYVFIRVYRENKSELTKKAMIIIELVGLLFVLILTGGIESPFLWYAINPILLSATLLPYYFCWSAAAGFISTAIFSQRFIAHYPDLFKFVWSDHTSIVLIYILVILVAQLFHHLFSKLSQQTDVMKNQIEHIKSLYETVEVFSHHSDPQEAINLFASYSKTLTGATKVIIWTEGEKGGEAANQEMIYAIRGPRYAFPEDHWYPYIRKLFENRTNGWKIDYAAFPTEGKEISDTLITVCIKSSTRAFGVLSAYFPGFKEKVEVEKVLFFLADLCAAVLGRRYLESMTERLLVAGEKERIARQMHDTVTQNLFGIIHGLNTLLRTDPTISAKTKEQLNLMQKISRGCLRDLRFSIYDLSNTKKEEEPFAEEVKTYLEDLKQLNDIDVEFECQGSFNDLSSAECNSFYRIIKEATSNALRHSACSRINVSLEATEEQIKLEITDNGSGFDQVAVLTTYDKKGLGLLSMKELTRNMGGELDIQSIPGTGTKVICRVNRQLQMTALSREERVVQ